MQNQRITPYRDTLRHAPHNISFNEEYLNHHDLPIRAHVPHNIEIANKTTNLLASKVKRGKFVI